MIDKTKPEGVYKGIACNLRDFGYDGISPNMIQEIHEAMNAGDEKLPHGVIGMFAKEQIEDAQQPGYLA